MWVCTGSACAVAIFAAALGNAYLSLFFSGGQDADALQRARSAYTNAVGDGWSSRAPCCPVRTALLLLV